jgi:hypothetical protein
VSAIDLYFGDPDGDHVRIRIVSRTDQVIRDHWDANWLSSSISVNVGGWRGKNGKAYFRTEELARLRGKVELLAEGRLSDAEFVPMEPHLRLRVAASDIGGDFQVTGTAVDRLEGGNVLTFSLATTSAGLENLAAQLRQVEKAHPTIG